MSNEIGLYPKEYQTNLEKLEINLSLENKSGTWSLTHK